MGYTDLWHCKRCGDMPVINMMGKNFLVKCNTCNSEETTFYANNVDEVVADWNRANDPNRTISFLERVRSWFKRR